MTQPYPVTPFRRLTGLVTAVLLAVLTLGGSAPVCGAHAEMGMTPGMSHDGQSVPMSGPMPAQSDCDDCAPVSDDMAPCDHSVMSPECAAMVGCLTLGAIASASASASPMTAATIVPQPVMRPHAVVLSPETPPPRADLPQAIAARHAVVLAHRR